MTPPDRPLPPVRRSRAIAAVAVVLALFFSPALLGGGVFAYRDTGRMHAPTKQWMGEELRAGRLPRWNPYAGLGIPVPGNAVDGAQHPFALLLALLPPAAALKAWILASYAIAAAGAFAWARALGRSDLAAACAAVAYALSGPLVSASDNVTYLTAYAALPLLFAAAHAATQRLGPRALALVALASAACAAAGDPQSWAFAVGLLPAYALAVGAPEGRRRALLRGLSAAAVALLAAAPFILPVVAWMGQSNRAAGLAPEELIRWNVRPVRLLELAVPGLFRGDPAVTPAPIFAAYAGNASTPTPWFLSLYLGASVVALALVGVAAGRRTRWLAAAAPAFAWASTGHHAGFLAIAAHLPVLGGFRFWEKTTIWLALIAAIAAARGLDALLDGRRPGAVARAAGVGAAALLLSAGAVALWPAGFHAIVGGPPEVAGALAANVAAGAGTAGGVLALLSLLAAALERGALGRLAPLALGALVALDLLGGNAGAYVLSRPMDPDRPPLARALPPGARAFSPFVARQDRWPDLDPIGNVWEWSRRTLDASWNVPLRVGSPRDYVGLREGRWSAYYESLGAGERVARLGLFGFGYAIVPGDPSLAVRAGVPPPVHVVAEDPALPAWLVEVPHRPRAYVAESVAAGTPAETLAFAMAGGEPGRTLVEGSVPAGLAPGVGSATLTVDLPGETVVEARAEGRSLLVLNDAWAPGWTATVDGAPAAIERANGLVRGVWIDAGTHAIRFTYSAPGLATGWAVALLLAAGLGAWALARRVRARRAAAAAGV